MKTLKLNVFGIELTKTSITSSMKEDDSPQNHLFNSCVDAIESMVLAHYAAGIDVTTPAYIEGIETAYEALGNNIDHITDDAPLLPGCDGQYYQWLMPTQIEDGLRFLHIEDEINLSQLLFHSESAAITAIKENVWGWDKQAAEEFVLVSVEKRQVNNPFTNTPHY